MVRSPGWTKAQLHQYYHQNHDDNSTDIDVHQRIYITERKGSRKEVRKRKEEDETHIDHHHHHHHHHHHRPLHLDVDVFLIPVSKRKKEERNSTGETHAKISPSARDRERQHRRFTALTHRPLWLPLRSDSLCSSTRAAERDPVGNGLGTLGMRGNVRGGAERRE